MKRGERGETIGTRKEGRGNRRDMKKESEERVES